MFTAARVIGVCVLAAIGAGGACADDKEPMYEGMTTAQWAGVVQNDKATPRQRVLAVRALGQLWILEPKTNAIDYVTAALGTDAKPNVRAEAAIVLAGLREADMLNKGAKPLVAALGTEKESRVRKEIIAAMVKHPAVCVTGVEPLAAVLRDPEAPVRVAAAEALALAGKFAKSAAADLAPLLKDNDKSVRVAAVYALGRISPDGATTVAEAMAAMLGTENDADPASKVKIKRELIASISLLGEKTTPVLKALTAAMSDKEEDDVRRAATRALGTFGSAAAPVADDLLKRVNTDKVNDIRVDAVRAFGSALGPTGVKARLKDLRPLLDPTKETSFEVRLAVIDEIAALGYEHLGVDLVSPDKGVKAEALETIVVLRQRLADPHLRVRESAAIAIRKIEKKPEPKKDKDKEPEPKKGP